MAAKLRLYRKELEVSLGLNFKNPIPGFQPEVRAVAEVERWRGGIGALRQKAQHFGNEVSEATELDDDDN